MDRWIRNTLIVVAGVLREIPRDSLQAHRPSPGEELKCLSWWIFKTFEAEYAGTANALKFEDGILTIGGDEESATDFLFGFRLTQDGSIIYSIFEDEFLQEDLGICFDEHLEFLLKASKLWSDKRQKDLRIKAPSKVEAPQILVCPECESDQVTTEHHQMFMVNTTKHYCHSMKPQDSDSPATCLTCDWKGERSDLRTAFPSTKPKAQNGKPKT